MSETPSETPKTPEIYKCCDNPQITYLTPVNINILLLINFVLLCIVSELLSTGT